MLCVNPVQITPKLLHYPSIHFCTMYTADKTLLGKTQGPVI